MIRAALSWIVGQGKTALYFLIVGAVATVAWLIRRSGADAERLRQAQADLKAASTIARERTEARGRTDSEIDREVDRWSR